MSAKKSPGGKSADTSATTAPPGSCLRSATSLGSTSSLFGGDSDIVGGVDDQYKASSPLDPQKSVRSAGSSAQVSSGSVGSAGNFNCTKCGKTLPLASMSSRNGVCAADHAAYKALTDRWNKQRALRQWWGSLTPDQQRAWFLKQQTLGTTRKRRFDDITFSESSAEQVSEVTEEQVMMIPWPVYKRNCLMEGIAEAEAEESFKALVEDPNVECELLRGQWLVPQFNGVLRARQHAHVQKAESTRTAKVQDAAHLESLRRGAETHLAAFDEGIAFTKCAAVEAPHCDSAPAEQPVRALANDIIGNAIYREVTQKLRDETMRRAFEADDILAASSASANAAQSSDGGVGRGRPRSVTMEKLKATAKILEIKAKFTEARTSLQADKEAVTKQFDSLFGGEKDMSSVIRDVRQELLDLDKSVQETVAAQHVALEQLATEVEAATDTATLDGLRDRVATAAKALGKGALQQMRVKLRNFRDAMAKEERGRKARGAKVAEVGDDAVFPALYTILLGYKGTDNLGVSASTYEAQGGIRACLVAHKPETDAVDELTKNAYVKKALKDVGAWCRQHCQSSGLFKLSEAPKRKKIEKILHASFDASLFATLLLPRGLAWAEQIFAPQVFGLTKGYINVGYTPFCCMEARLVLTGCEVVAGIPVESVKGLTVKEKRKTLYMSTVDQIRELVSNHGWMCVHGAGECLLVPTGFLVLMASDGCEGLRWSLSGDTKDTERCKMALTGVLDSFPEMKNSSTGYSQLLDFLTAE